MKIISRHPLANACAVVTEDGRASILNITYGPPVAGARVEGNGTLQHPLRVVIEDANLLAADVERLAADGLSCPGEANARAALQNIRDRLRTPADTPRIVAVVSGGILQSAYASPSLPAVEFELFDFDDKEAEGGTSEAVESEFDELTAGLVVIY